MKNFEASRTGASGVMQLPKLDWDKQGGMVPAIVQDNADGAVLMVGWMDPPALEKTLATGNVSFFSRSRGVPWTKGETSGNFLRMTAIAKDCEGGDTLVVLADPVGPTCSEGGRTCFDGTEKQIVGNVTAARKRWALGGLIAGVDMTFDERQGQIDDAGATSYTLGLLRDSNKALKKFGEETLEFTQAVLEEDILATEQELADLVFGAITFARARGKSVSLERVMQILTDRNQAKRAGSDERFNLPTERGQQYGNAS